MKKIKKTILLSSLTAVSVVPMYGGIHGGIHGGGHSASPTVVAVPVDPVEAERLAAQRRQQEQQRQAEAERQRLAQEEADRQAEAERQRLAQEEADRQAEAERQRLAQDLERQRQEQVAQRVRGVIDDIIANGGSDLGNFVTANVRDADGDELLDDEVGDIVNNIVGAMGNLKKESNGTLAASMEVNTISGKRELQQLIAGTIDGVVRDLQVSSNYEAQQDALISPWMTALN